MGKVYIITSGTYSDYRILAPFSSKELAQNTLNKLEGAFPQEEIRIEEYTVNVGVNSSSKGRGLLPFEVTMKRNGDTESVNLASNLIIESPLLQYPGTVLFTVMAVDEKHAVKICGDRRAQLIASNEWPLEF